MQQAVEHGAHIPYLREAIVFLVAAVVIAPLFQRLRASPVLGYLIVGILLGPFSPIGVSLVERVEGIAAFAKLGVVFLLFAIGLELSIERLRSMRRLVFGMGGAQVLLCGGAIAGAALFYGLSPVAALIVGGALALSSTAMVLQILIERGEFAAREGRAAFAVLLFQDLMVVPLLVLIAALTGGGESIGVLLAIAALKAAAAVGVILVIGRWILRPLFRLIAQTKSHDIFIALALLACVGTAWATAQFGLSMVLGAFLAGLMLAGSEFRHQIAADIDPFKGLLLGLFFITVGMGVDLALVLEETPRVLALVVALLVLKAVLITGLGLAFGLSPTASLRVGLLLSAGGEFAFILLGAAAAGGALDHGLARILLVVVSVSMAITPLLAAAGKRIAVSFERRRPDDEIASLDEETADLAEHVLVAGFGRVGQTVVKLLQARQVPYIALDLDSARVAEAHRAGMPVYYGDCRREAVLVAAGARRARAAVITLDDAQAAARSVAALRQSMPDLEIFVRARDRAHAVELESLGATAGVPETLEASLQLAGRVLRAVDLPLDDVDNLIDWFRQADYAALRDVIPAAQTAEDATGDGNRQT